MSEEINYDDYDNDVDLDPANRPVSNRVDRFKGETGKTYRVALLHFHPLQVTLRKALMNKAQREGTQFDPNVWKETVNKALAKRAADYNVEVSALVDWQKLDWSTAQFKKYKSQYHDDVGPVVSRLGEEGPDADKVWKALGEVRENYSTIALFYPLDPSGNTDTKNILRDGYVKLWRFSKGTFSSLISKNEMLSSFGRSLASIDLKLTCKSGQYQTFEIEPAGDALWLKSPSARDKFLPMAHALYPKLIDARTLSTDEVREKLHLGGGSGGVGDNLYSGGSDTPEDDLANILSSV